MAVNLTPVTVVSGYLGSGKTTLLNQFISSTDTSNVAILVNDFGALNIDADIVELGGGTAFRLESGCICCNIGNSLVTTLLAIVRQPVRPNKIIIEASGVADPARIMDIARLSPSLAAGRIVTMVDGPEIQRQFDDKLIGDVVRQQLVSADIIAMAKSDLLGSVESLRVLEWLSSVNPSAERLDVCFGKMPMHGLFSPPAESRTAKCGAAGDVKDHESVFWSWSYEFDGAVDKEQFERGLSHLLPQIERAKGFVSFTAAPDKVVLVQVAGNRTFFTPVNQETNFKRHLRLQCIGVGQKPDVPFLERLFA